MNKAPSAINGNRLRFWNKALWSLGFIPFWRCPNGEHVWGDIYGDEILVANARSICGFCTARSQTLMNVQRSDS